MIIVKNYADGEEHTLIDPISQRAMQFPDEKTAKEFLGLFFSKKEINSYKYVECDEDESDYKYNVAKYEIKQLQKEGR